MKYKLIEAGALRGMPALFIDEYAEEISEEKLRNAIDLFGFAQGKKFVVLDGALNMASIKKEPKTYGGRSLVALLKERGFFVIVQARPDVIANHAMEANSLEFFIEPGESWFQCKCSSIVVTGVPPEDFYVEDFLAATPKFLWLSTKNDVQRLPSFLRMNSYPWVVQIGSAGPLEVQL